jgi:hypothetical protein
VTEDDRSWFKGRFQALEDRFQPLEDRLIEKMRDVQTEILRGFKAHSDGLTVRLRKIEADESNLDLALSQRMEILERRLLEIETKLDHTKGEG